MRDSNYTDEQLKMTAPSMRLTRIMTKFLIQYIYVVCLISSLDVITQCQCSQSANTQISDSANGDAQQRKVPDGIESITTFTNLIGEPSPVINYGDQFTKEFQYYEDPSVHTTLKYEPPSIEIPNNHKPVHELDLNESYFPLEPLPYIPGHNFIPPPPPPPKHYLKVKEPFWMPEVVQLENQYIDTFRSIKSSVMNFYYRMQNFVNYFVNMFSFGEFSQFSQLYTMHFMYIVCWIVMCMRLLII